MSDTLISYINLANAIIATAVNDYCSAIKVKHGSVLKHYKKNNEMLCDVRDFFFSDWFETLNWMDHNVILKRLLAGDSVNNCEWSCIADVA